MRSSFHRFGPRRGPSFCPRLLPTGFTSWLSTSARRRRGYDVSGSANCCRANGSMIRARSRNIWRYAERNGLARREMRRLCGSVRDALSGNYLRIQRRALFCECMGKSYHLSRDLLLILENRASIPARSTQARGGEACERIQSRPPRLLVELGKTHTARHSQTSSSMGHAGYAHRVWAGRRTVRVRRLCCEQSRACVSRARLPRTCHELVRRFARWNACACPQSREPALWIFRRPHGRSDHANSCRLGLGPLALYRTALRAALADCLPRFRRTYIYPRTRVQDGSDRLLLGRADRDALGVDYRESDSVFSSWTRVGATGQRPSRHRCRFRLSGNCDLFVRRLALSYLSGLAGSA